jgi:hypothetical protein
MIHFTISVAYLAPWLSILAVIWAFLLGGISLAELIGGVLVFFVLTIVALTLIGELLDRIHRR